MKHARSARSGTRSMAVSIMFDTAPIYHLGKSEQVLGRALAGGYREKVRIATKLPHWSVYERADMDRILDGS